MADNACIASSISCNVHQITPVYFHILLLPHPPRWCHMQRDTNVTSSNAQADSSWLCNSILPLVYMHLTRSVWPLLHAVSISLFQSTSWFLSALLDIYQDKNARSLYKQAGPSWWCYVTLPWSCMHLAIFICQFLYAMSIRLFHFTFWPISVLLAIHPDTNDRSSYAQACISRSSNVIFPLFWIHLTISAWPFLYAVLMGICQLTGSPCLYVVGYIPRHTNVRSLYSQVVVSFTWSETQHKIIAHFQNSFCNRNINKWVYYE